MTAMSPRPPSRRPTRPPRLAAVAAVLALALLASGCTTGPPGEISVGDLAEAKTFPYFRVYWVGPSFQARPLAAVDGLRNYVPSVGDGVYYGDCVKKKGIFGGGSCALPLQVITVLYHLHSNKALGPQRNTVVRGVRRPSTTAGARSRSTPAGSPLTSSPTPTHTPSPPPNPSTRQRARLGRAAALPRLLSGLYGPTDAAVEAKMDSLPGLACQKARGTTAFSRAVSGD